MLLVPPVDPCRGGRLADTACWRRCHASIKSRQTSPTGDERQNTRKSGPSPADSLKVSQLAAGRDLLHGVGRHRRTESKQQASKQRSAKAAVNAEPDSLIEPLRRVADRDGKRPLRGTHGAEPIAAADDKRGSDTSVAPFRRDQSERKQEVSPVQGHHGCCNQLFVQGREEARIPFHGA